MCAQTKLAKHSKIRLRDHLRSGTTSHLGPQFARIKFFLCIQPDLRPPYNVGPKVTILWPRVHILPVKKKKKHTHTHLNEILDPFGPGTFSSNRKVNRYIFESEVQNCQNSCTSKATLFFHFVGLCYPPDLKN